MGDKSEWRYVWKECVDAGQKSLLLGDEKLERFFSSAYQFIRG